MAIVKDISCYVLPVMSLGKFLLFISLPPPGIANAWKGKKLAETRYFKQTG